MQVTKVVEENISNKIDTAFIQEQFKHLDNVVITFLCTRDERDLEDWVDEDGWYIVIRLPYKEVLKSVDVRPLMLAKVKEKLGLVA